MNTLINLGADNEKTASTYLVEQINIFRQIENNKVNLLHKSLLAKIEIEFQEEIGQQSILPSSYLAGNGKQEKCYYLDFEQSLQLLMSESKTVRKRCVEVIKSKQKPVLLIDPFLTQLRKDKHIQMTDALKEQRQRLGKTTEFFHYVNLNKFLGELILGKGELIKKRELTLEQEKEFANLRTNAISMFELDMEFAEVKERLIKRLATLRLPKLLN